MLDAIHLGITEVRMACIDYLEENAVDGVTACAILKCDG